MDALNYHHLLYFYTVVRAGGVARAARDLGLAQPTISGQIARLEQQIGEKLFRRVGRKLELTETGRMVFGYAEEMFAIGEELQQTLRGRPQQRPLRFLVGVADVVPKLIVFRLLEPVFALDEPVQLICHEGRTEDLLDELLRHQYDLVLTDALARPSTRTRVFNHLLGECGITLFGAPHLARKYRPGFPESLADAPWLLPFTTTSLRRSLDQWLGEQGMRPRIRGEFADSALLKVFGQSGVGIFALPSAIEDDAAAQYGVEVIGRIDSVSERYYAVSAERRLKHPAVRAISETARLTLFGEGGSSG